MKHYLLIMHTDVMQKTDAREWDVYITKLRKNGHFGGGSSVGAGFSFKQGSVSGFTSHWIGGYMIVNANDIAEAKTLVDGNPVLLAGGTVELRDLPES